MAHSFTAHPVKLSSPKKTRLKFSPMRGMNVATGLTEMATIYSQVFDRLASKPDKSYTARRTRSIVYQSVTDKEKQLLDDYVKNGRQKEMQFRVKRFNEDLCEQIGRDYQGSNSARKSQKLPRFISSTEYSDPPVPITSAG